MDPISDEMPERHALLAFRKLFEEADGWHVMDRGEQDHAGDVLLRSDRGHTFLAALKAFNDGRADRVTAAFAQMLLEARVHAKRQGMRPAILIWVRSASPALIRRLVEFHREYGDSEPFAVLSMDGTRYVRFPGFELDKPSDAPIGFYRSSDGTRPRLVLSDLAQWMLKLMLAPDIAFTSNPDDGDEPWLGAENMRYGSATDLARAAGVSLMTATRLVNGLIEEGFLETRPFLKLVQRGKLARRWKAEYRTPALALPMKFLSEAAPDVQLRRLLQRQGGILGNFAAAEALGFGHVKGVTPTVWVHNLREAENWRPLRPAKEGERPDLVLQQPSFPRSLMRGCVDRKGVRVTDLIQTWLDVSAHPARGAEMAAELEHGVLAKVVGEGA
ncbi:helix-turn-helix domain-containing protein [Burkholderia contaminans]|uniref:MarR family transcriptional regulator n=1 Tax=Burkholderia contaminans TaxID=488447 RepID=A0A3N8R2U4_9BURK|nr:helix-turn-helix domain-containing protein [Burkholderia contaminans]RQT12663.1 MarR family transcriptional regulator [Burkholderia contaminans]